ncbi:MAG: TIGR02710 family CRISPR-associated CARF protein [Halochromatium sp.]|uniref:TIGR02710 family CRISPR-associated CARF protein n=1 Tax=Halochromatium sp. TaxID=2049430 RepID=UPI00397D0EF0
MSETILLCTVGGSHQPILTAIRECAPTFVQFFASGTDATTGRAGSISTITGKGTPVEVRRGAEVIERLPNIPTQLGLAPAAFDAQEIPSDDLDQAVTLIATTIEGLRQRFPGAALVADYTGGTKTMTAALVMVAVEAQDIALQVITGPRADLLKVSDGSQAGLAVGVEGIRLRRGMRPFLDAWQRYAYGEAADGFGQLPLPRDGQLRAELQLARGLSRVFDAWDRFNHAAAEQELELYRQRLGQEAGAVIGPLFTALKELNAAPDSPKRTPARLWDLWLNAQRRAAQGRYDDAIARGYRLLEWTAQWLLGTQGIDTSDLRSEQIPDSLPIAANPDGKRQAGLRNAWALAAHHLGGEVQTFVDAEGSHMLDHLKKRNYSILAHGDQPIAKADWQAFGGWIEAALIPLLHTQAARAGLKRLAPQLPQAPFWQR